jgi:peptidoglycan hydrolase-like protein with peptidoglycan-binding domain
MNLRQRQERKRLAEILGAVTIPTAGAKYTDKATVSAVQTALNAKGFGPLKVDGLMGPKTSASITAMQFAAGEAPSGVIDEGVIMALGVTPGVLPPGVTAAGKAAVEAEAALDAATAAEHAETPSDVQAAAAQVVAAVPADQPALKQAAVSAHVAAVSATTPAQAVAARAQVQAVAQQVKAAVSPPVPWWQWAILGTGGAAVVVGLGALVFGGSNGKRRRR